MTLIKFKNQNGFNRATDRGIYFPSVFSEAVENLFGNEFFTDRTLTPSANISENESRFLVELTTPGFKKEDLKISVEKGTITVSAEHKEEKKDENIRITRKEFSFGSFSRSFTLPDSVDADHIQAAMENGVLSLTLPKKQSEKPQPAKEIKVS